MRNATFHRGLLACLLVFMALSASAQEPLRFTVYQPVEGESWRVEGSVRSQFDYQVDIDGRSQEESSSSVSEVELAVDVTRVEDGALRQVSARWDRAETTTDESGKPPQREVSPLQGKSYRVDWSTSSPPVVTRGDGSAPSPEEVELVLDGLGHLESPQRLSEFFASQGPVEEGRVLRLPPAILRDAWSSDVLVAERMVLTLRRIVESAEGRIGVFDTVAHMVSPKGAPYRNEAKMDGELRIRESGSRIVVSDLSGPVRMSGEWGDDPVIRLSGRGTVDSVHEVTPER